MSKKMKFMMLPQAVTTADPVSVTPEDILARMRCSYVEQNVNGFRQKLAEGVSPDEEYMKKMKQNLPLLFCAQGLKEPGKGRRNNFIHSPAFGIDLDHIPGDVRKLYDDIIAPRVKELRIGMVQVTIKQHGLHLWADRLPGEPIPAAQQRVASALGLETYLDSQCIDLGRGFFLTTEKDLLYFDANFFCMTEEEAEQAKHFDEIDNTNKIDNLNKSNNNMININTNQSAPTGALAYKPQDKPLPNIQTEYQGAKLSDIVDEFIRLAMPTGIHVGDRNKNMFKIFVNLLQICNNNHLAALQATKHITGIPQTDIDSTLRSACSTIFNGGASMNNLFQRAINNCVAEAKYAAQEDGMDIDTQSSTPSLPQYPLPPILELVTKNIPQPFIVPTLILANPILGTLLSDVQFNYWYDAIKHHFAFLSLLIADQSAGKSSIIFPRLKMLAKPLHEEDEQAEEEWDIYDRAVARLKPGDQMPPKPKQSCRITPTDITSAAFFDVLNRANGKTTLLYDDEGNSFFRTGGGPEFQVTREIIKNAYDQGDYKLRRKDGSKFSGPVACNFALAGTPALVDNFSSAGEGDAGRFMIATLEGLTLHQPRIIPLTPDEQNRIYALAKSLTQQSGTRYATWIDTEAEKYRDELEDRYTATANDALLFLYRRIVVDFTRNAYMYAGLFGCDQKEWNEQPRPEDEEKRQACLAWAKYLAEYSLSQTLRYFGKKFELCATDIPPQVVYPDLYGPLGDTFTFQELGEICTKMNHYKGNPTRVRNVWIRQGWIEQAKDENGRIMRGQYRKIKKTN